MPGELFSCSYWNGRTPCFIIGAPRCRSFLSSKKHLQPPSRRAPTRSSSSLRWGIWAGSNAQRTQGLNYRSRQSHTSSYLSRNVRSASRNPNLLYRAMAGFCGVVVLRTRVRKPWTQHQSTTAWVNRLPTPRRRISSATRSRLSSATSSLRRHSRPSGRSGGISASVVGPMTCTVPTILSSPLPEGAAATQLAEASRMTLSGAEAPSAFHLRSPVSLARFALSYIASTSASSPGRYGLIPFQRASA